MGTLPFPGRIFVGFGQGRVGVDGAQNFVQPQAPGCTDARRGYGVAVAGAVAHLVVGNGVAAGVGVTAGVRVQQLVRNRYLLRSALRR